MTIKLTSACLLAAALALTGEAQAWAAAPAPPKPAASAAAPPPSAPEEKADGSDFVRCDGYPRKISGAEAMARILAITATGGIVGGLVGGLETANKNKRVEGAGGVAACEAALSKEKDGVRRADLTFALAIHHMEAKDDVAALADAQAIPPDAASRADFQRGTQLSFYELQAAINLRLGRPADAEAAALKMADAEPLDLIAQFRAASYITLTGTQTPAKDAYYDRLARMYPAAVVWEAAYKEWRSDWLGAAADLAAYDEAAHAFLGSAAPKGPPYVSFIAHRSVEYLLAGDMATSNKLADEARADIDEMVKTGTALNSQSAVNEAQELLDLQAIGRQYAEGKTREARIVFANRAHWLGVGTPLIAAVNAMVRKGAAPEELTGALTADPAKVRADGLAARLGQLQDQLKTPTSLYGALRILREDGESNTIARNVWNTNKSPYIRVRTAKDEGKYNGEFVAVLGVRSNTLSAEALMLHCALIARARGKQGFVLSPYRPKAFEAFVLFGSSGEPGLPAPVFNDAQTVIDGAQKDIASR